MNISMRPILGERELAIAWLAENDILPYKNEWGRYSLKELDGDGQLNAGITFLIVDNLGIDSEEDLKEIRHTVKNHPRWDE
jgi:hypothetical protein